ncbi:hypothetical protein TNCV_2082981 [Trichonephila clavipes]|nr:hypothetical protein TNCV_2082981 [Trichonephila clavipes]
MKKVTEISLCNTEGPSRNRWKPEICEEITFWGLINGNHICPQTKSFLLAKTFIDSNLTVTPHKSLNSLSWCHIRAGPFIRFRRRNTRDFLTRVLPSPKLPTTIKAGYLNLQNTPKYTEPLCAVSNARGSVTPKIPAVAN